MTTQHLFFFDFGCLVCWGCSEAEEMEVVDLIQPAVKMFEVHVGPAEEDDMIYHSPAEGGTRQLKFRNDEMTLSSSSSVEKFAISFAFAQSTKLSVDEQNVDQTIAQSRVYPEALAQTGHVPLTQKDVHKKVGELFIFRYKIFLDSSLWNTPEFFWHNPDEYEEIYLKAKQYLDIDKRMEVLQQRLDVVRELYGMLVDSMNNEQASYMEWLIIWLIVADCFSMILFGMVDFRCVSMCDGDDNGSISRDHLELSDGKQLHGGNLILSYLWS